MVPWHLVACEARRDFSLAVRFAGGLTGVVDMRPLLARPDLGGTVFGPLRDLDMFMRARVEHGAVTWPNGADLAPDAMHDAIAARGAWQPA